MGVPHRCPCAGKGPAPEGSSCAQGHLLGIKREEIVPPPPPPPHLDAELGHREKNTFTPSETRNISRALCFQFKTQIKGGGYFRKQMVMIRVLSLK